MVMASSSRFATSGSSILPSAMAFLRSTSRAFTSCTHNIFILLLSPWLTNTQNTPPGRIFLALPEFLVRAHLALQTAPLAPSLTLSAAVVVLRPAWCLGRDGHSVMSGLDNFFLSLRLVHLSRSARALYCRCLQSIDGSVIVCDRVCEEMSSSCCRKSERVCMVIL